MKHRGIASVSLLLAGGLLIAIKIPWVHPWAEKALLEITGICSSALHVAEERVHRFLNDSTSQRKKFLEQENAKLRGQILELEVIRSENKVLEKNLNVPRLKKVGRFCTAHVLTTPLRGWNQMFLIGAGEKDGVRKGQPVLCAEGVVGRIDAVSASFSRVMPLTHQLFRMPVIGLKTRTQAILAGNGSAKPALVHMVESSLKDLDDEVFVSSTQGGQFPPGQVAAKWPVGSVRTSLEICVPWHQLEFVTVCLDFPLFKEKSPDVPKERKKTEQ